VNPAPEIPRFHPQEGQVNIHEKLRASQAKVMKNLLFWILLNSIPSIVLPLTVGVSSHEAETCNKDFYTLGMLFWAYFVFFAARDALTLIVVIWFQECEWIMLAV